MSCCSMIFGTILGLYRQPGFDILFFVAGLEPAALIRSDLWPERAQDVDAAGRLVASGGGGFNHSWPQREKRKSAKPCLLRKNKSLLHVKNVMDKKLTLSLDEAVIEHAKLYAEKNKISLSKLIEAYLKAIVDNKTKNVEITPLVKSISGVIELPSDFDLRDEYTKYLIEKYR
ncbi:MAG: DUF6364 family protein [Saprospiraceae bacterium]|nr:DUF6364 family protein [Saprospiraceae bacterium]